LLTHLGHHPRIADDEITEPHKPIPDDTQAHEPVVPPPTERVVPAGPPPGAPPPAAPLPPGAPPPADAGVPPRLIQDVWPWLALLGILAIAALLVWLFAFRGNDNKGHVVPRVVGLQQQQAITKLTGDGFGVRAIIGTSRKPRGIVVSQSPGAGSRLGSNQSVVIHVSNGRPVAAPPTTTTASTGTTTTSSTTSATTTSAAPVSVPDVTGQDAASGAGQVEAAGFVAETDPVSGSGTAGSISSESPSGGAQAQAGSVVKLSVETGASRPSEQVPSVVGQKAGAARAAILNAKLTVRTEYKQGPAKSVGVVVAQTPSGGSAPAYTQVTITVGA
jgi:beta-lactam-binding protein with PASTA domain